MAGTVTVTPAPQVGPYGREISKVSVAWTSDASGNATGTLTAYGYLLKAVTNPDDSAAPTDNYDITLVQDGVDAACGLLIDRDTANTEQVYGIAKNSTDVAPVPPFLAGDHTFTVANAGNAKSGVCILYIVESL